MAAAFEQIPIRSATVLNGSEHKDLIHDVAYDYYGKRLATVGSDHCVKIWDRSGDSWKVSGQCDGHTGSVWRCSWAHPEYGQVIASCSYDHTVKIYEEQPHASGPKWTKRAELADSRKPVTGVQFAPKHVGLKLAACSEEGVIRIYEAMDVMNLASWTQEQDFKVKGKAKCSSLSWNPSRRVQGMIAVGCTGSDQSGSNIQVFEQEESRRWSLALDRSTLMASSLAASSSVGDFIEDVNDVAFAPNMGRSYFLLAAACKSAGLYLWKITPNTNAEEKGKYKAEVLLRGAKAGDGGVSRVSWNVTGTVLATSADNGNVSLFQANYANKWEEISSFDNAS